jgi:hypothetical protein
VIETKESYKNLWNDIKGHTLILSVIACDEFIHPIASSPSLVFIRDTTTSKTHVISFAHPDCCVVTDIKTFSQDLKNLNQIIWTLDKKTIYQYFPNQKYYDIDLYTHLTSDKIFDKSQYQTSAHRLIYQQYNQQKYINNAIPLLKHQEMFEKICEEFQPPTKVEPGYIQENQTIIETLSELELVGIHVNEKCFKAYFDVDVHNNLVYSQYNIYTSTGRPSNRFNNVNYAALNKSDGTRKCFTSRFGDDGSMVLIDYSAFHPRIICKLIDFHIPLETDIYQYLGELYFNRKITEYDLDEIKTITMRQLYGGVEEKYEHIKYFSKLKDFIFKNWFEFKKTGQVLTPFFNRPITNKHLVDENPSKLFNYILQATETEVAVSSLKYVNQYLKDKQTKAVLYTYDSILFDFHKTELPDTLNHVMNIMKMGDRFPIKVYQGDSYDKVIQIYP